MMCGWGGYGQYPGEPSGGSEDEKDALAETRGRRWQLRRRKCWVRRRRRKCTKRTSAASSIISHLCYNSFASVHSALDLVSKSFASNATTDSNTYWQLAAAAAHANACSTSDYTPKPTFASVDMDIGSMSGTGSEIGGGSLFIWFYSNRQIPCAREWKSSMHNLHIVAQRCEHRLSRHRLHVRYSGPITHIGLVLCELVYFGSKSCNLTRTARPMR